MDADPSQLVLATAERPDADDRSYRQKVPVGDSEWLLVVAAKRPLAGDLMAASPGSSPVSPWPVPSSSPV